MSLTTEIKTSKAYEDIRARELSRLIRDYRYLNRKTYSSFSRQEMINLSTELKLEKCPLILTRKEICKEVKKHYDMIYPKYTSLSKPELWDLAKKYGIIRPSPPPKQKKKSKKQSDKKIKIKVINKPKKKKIKIIRELTETDQLYTSDEDNSEKIIKRLKEQLAEQKEEMKKLRDEYDEILKLKLHM